MEGPSVLRLGDREYVPRVAKLPDLSDVAVPVVPCDDAAIERATEAFENALMGRGGGDEFLYEMDDDVRAEFTRAMAVVVLRAAGETP